MVNVLFPIAARAQQRAQDGEEDGEQPRRKRRAESNLHSTDLWHLPGGAITGEQCYEIVKEKTLAKRAKVSEAAQRKAARAETRKSARALANELGFNICRNLQSDAAKARVRGGLAKCQPPFLAGCGAGAPRRKFLGYDSVEPIFCHYADVSRLRT